MNAVSAQDDFAKWAKLRRQHDKAEAELEKHSEQSSCTQGFNGEADSFATAASHAASKAKFDTAVAGARWLATNGLRYFLQFWYSKQPMFWLPKGLMPGYVEWFLAFPRAPTGSISIQLWGVACLAAIKLVSEAIVAVLAMTNMSKGQAKAHPLAFEMQGMKQGDMGKSRKEL